MFEFLKYIHNLFVKINKHSDNSVKPDQSKLEKPFYRPSKSKIEECTRLGLEIKPNMSNYDVLKLLEEALKDPKIRKRHDDYIAEQNAICEAEEREEFGNDVVDEQQKWAKLCLVGVQHIVIFKKGKTIEAEILEFERADIQGESKYHVVIEALKPKIYKPRGESPYIEWVKEFNLRPQHIMDVLTLPTPIDLYDIKAYEHALNKAKALKEKCEKNIC